MMQEHQEQQMDRFSRYEKDFMGVMKGIHNKDEVAVSQAVQQIYGRYFLTESLATDFLTWVFAQHAIILFEFLDKVGLTLDQEMQVRDAQHATGTV